MYNFQVVLSKFIQLSTYSLISVGTTILAPQYSVTHDERFYKDADSFIPERFLDNDGNFRAPEGKHFTSFGIGKH